MYSFFHCAVLQQPNLNSHAPEPTLNHLSPNPTIHYAATQHDPPVSQEAGNVLLGLKLRYKTNLRHRHGPNSSDFDTPNPKS